MLPRTVHITAPSVAKEGSKVQLTCTTEGSIPSSTITWTIQGVTRPTEKQVNHFMVIYYY